MSKATPKMADLYDTYAPGATRLAYLLTGDKHLAEDLAQEAFLRMLGRFEFIRRPASFQAYLHRTVVNLSRNHWRRRELERRYETREGHLRSRHVVDAPDTETASELWTAQPGAQFPWHTHPGPVFVNVAQGELIYVRADECAERSYPTGTAFVDPGKKSVHTAFNPTTGVTVLYATFFNVPETGPLTITEGVEEPDDCPIEVGPHSSH